MRVTNTRTIAVDRIDVDVRHSDKELVVVEAPLQLRARGTPVATIMRTPGHDLELARGLLHAESIRAPMSASGNEHSSPGDAARELRIEQVDDDAIEIDVDASAFAGRGLLSSAACGVCGRVAIADLELRATSVAADTMVDHRVIAALPDRLRAAQEIFEGTGGLHAAGLFTTDGELVAAREDVGRHNAVDKLVGWALGPGRDDVGGARAASPRAGSALGGARTDPSRLVLMLSGRAGYELVQKAIVFGVPVVASVSAPSSLAVELAERFNVALAGFVRGTRMNVYSHGWRIL